MNPPDRNHSHHSNGQAASHARHRSPAVEEREPPARVRPQSQDVAAPTDLAFAFHATQESLAALQRLAEQTADLHRQFLEGQEKTQQTFLKLLEHQQRLSHAMPDPAEARPCSDIGPEAGYSDVPAAQLPARETPRATRDAESPVLHTPPTPPPAWEGPPIIRRLRP